MIETAKEVTAQLSGWLANNPTVTSEDEARKIKLQIDRAKLCLKDLEDERDKKVRPLNERVSDINATHRQVRKPLGSILDHMLEVLDGFIKAEEAKRIKAALEAKARSRELEARARDAESKEREQKENSLLGEVDLDIAKAVEEADQAFHDYVKAEREAIRATEEIHVKIGGGLGRAIGLRDKEILHVDDAAAALQEMGLVENIRLAILTAARAFKKLHNRLPNGISVTIDRNVK